MPRRSRNQNANTSSSSSTNSHPTSSSYSTNPHLISTSKINFTYSDNFNNVTELTTDNYVTWKTYMLHFLDINNLIDFIFTEKVTKININKVNNLSDYIVDKINPFLVYSKDTNEDDIKLDNITKWIILNSLGNNTKRLIETRGKTAYESWKILENTFTKGKEQLYAEIIEKLNNLKYDTSTDINIFIASLENLFNELEHINKPLSEDAKVGFFNRSLPEELRWINVFQFSENWTLCQNFATKVIPGIIFSNLKEKNINKTEKSSLNAEKIKKYNNTHKKYNSHKNKFRCKICKKHGHQTHECFFNKNNKNKHNLNKNKQRRNKSNYKFKKHYNRKFNNKNNNAYLSTKNNNNYDSYKNDYLEVFTQDYNSKFLHESNYVEKNNQNTIPNPNKISNNLSLWTLDSGASTHMTYISSILINKRPHKEKIRFANGEEVTSTHIGDFIGYINNNEIKLLNVLLIPGFKKNLISISQLIEQRYKIIFNSNNKIPCTNIYNPIGERILTINVCGDTNTFKIWISNHKITNTNNYNKNNSLNQNLHCSSSEKSKLNNEHIWHRRIGHFNIKGLINHLPNINDTNKCKICSKSKLKNKPFYDAPNKSKTILELIHLDLIGPITESIYGKKYVFTILDDFSWFNWVLFLENKSDAFDKFVEWSTEVTNILNKKIKYIKSDNGKEFVTNNFNIFCKNNGIIHLLTVPYTPQQNGRVERLNGVLIGSATAMLQDALLSKRFWQDAISTASFIYNRLPHKAINNQIPYEIVYNEPIRYNNFRVFGCKVFFLLPKPYQKKFQIKGLPGIFIGYCNNPEAYKIFDITNNKVVISRTVDFYEDSPANFYFNKTISDIDTTNLENNQSGENSNDSTNLNDNQNQYF